LGLSDTEEVKEEKEQEIADLSQFLLLNDANAEPAKLRLIGLYGEVTEENAAETTYSLMALKEMGKKEELSNPEDPESDTIVGSRQSYVSRGFTFGGWH
jgi:hypothetical protein